METQIQIIDERQVLEKEFRIYGTLDKPLFLAKDVANWIEHSNTRMMLKKVDEEEKECVNNPYALQGQQEQWFLTEDGLYEILMLSRKPIAKQFKKQVKNILKTIRKTGGVVQNGREEEFIDKYFPSFSEEVKLSMVQDLLKTNKELKPKADYHDKVLNPSHLKTTTDIAKDLGLSARKLNAILHSKEIIFPKKVKGKTKGWYLYSKYEHLTPEYADYCITEYGQTLKWTEKGRKFILELLET